MGKNYDRPVQVADGIHWVGFRDQKSDLSCNPYLVVEGDAALLIDSGSRSDFAAVMMKVLQAGVDPQRIVGLVYQHYDPDLCGSMPNFVDMCDNPALRVISEKSNHVFISFYIHRDRHHLMEAIDRYDYRFDLNGRQLTFIPTPYAHSPGSFVTYDEKTRTLFTSDLFGSYAIVWDLFLELEDSCFDCADYDDCPNLKPACPVKDILAFHREMMPCTKALRHAMATIKTLKVDRIAPQHGSILHRKRDIAFIVRKLDALKRVGIDGIL